MLVFSTDWENVMQELTLDEVQQVGGGMISLTSWIRDFRTFVLEIPATYDAMINSAADVMCRGTGNC